MEALETVFTISQVAELEHCSESTIRTEISRGQLRAYRVGSMWRIPESALVEYRNRVVTA